MWKDLLYFSPLYITHHNHIETFHRETRGAKIIKLPTTIPKSGLKPHKFMPNLTLLKIEKKNSFGNIKLRF
jgi:hypothetical protein